jgi:copper chaperone CopZ
MILNIYLRKWIHRDRKTKKAEEIDMDNIIIKVGGMTCQHCKTNVENSIRQVEGIKRVEVNLDKAEVQLVGDNINLAQVKEAVESIGYKFGAT